MSLRTWLADGPNRALRRKARQWAYTRCQGDTATHWTGMDFQVCGKEGCTMPNDGPCLANEESEAKYLLSCLALGVEPR